MNIEDLVPPLGLCRKIPEGEFADSALVWLEVEIPQEWRATVANELIRRCHNRKLPAPTLEEILQELVNLSAYRINVCKSWGEWHIDCYDNEHLIEKDSVKNIATAALKLWLKLKGIEDEQ